MTSPDMIVPFSVLTEMVPRPYTSDTATEFRDFLVSMARKTLEKDGEMETFLAFLMPVPGHPIEEVHATGIIPANSFMQSEETKNLLARLSHQTLKTFNALACVFVSEIWMATMEENDPLPPSEKPDRKSGLMVVWERYLPGGSLDSHCWIYPILQEDDKMLLGEHEEIRPAGGRFTSFLPPPPTSERN